MNPEIKERLRKAHLRRYSNPDYRAKVLSQNAEWDALHSDDQKKRSLRWRNRNLQKARASSRRWAKTPAGRKWYQARDHARRAAKMAATINPKSIELFIENTRSKRRVPCHYCSNLVAGKDVHFDHMIPLSKGGAHAVENLCVACPKCNHSKSNKLIKEWLTLGQQLLEL